MRISDWSSDVCSSDLAAQRRALPPGGAVPEDYAFERIGAYQRPETVRLSELFGDKSSIILQSFMFGPERDMPCPGCTHMLDAIDGSALHVGQRAPLHVVAKSPIARPEAWAKERQMGKARGGERGCQEWWKRVG